MSTPAETPAAGSRLLVAGLCAALLAGCVIAPTRHPERYRRDAPPPQATAEPMYFYPQRGQTEGQQDRDRYECYRLAVRDSGVDPGMTPVSRPWGAPPPPPRSDGAEVVGGAAAGAIVGAAVSRPRHAGEGAVMGAVFGALLGVVAQQARNQAVEAAQERQAATAARARQPLDNFRRAMGACMQARGYTVG